MRGMNLKGMKWNLIGRFSYKRLSVFLEKRAGWGFGGELLGDQIWDFHGFFFCFCKVCCLFFLIPRGR